MNYIDWLKELDRGLTGSVYLCLAEEPYLWEMMKKLIRETVVGEALLDFNYELQPFDALDEQRLETALETMPLMADRRAVVLESLPLGKDQVKKADAMLALLDGYFDRMNPSTVLFLHYPEASPFNGKYYKRMRQCAKVVTLDRPDRAGLERFIDRQLEKQGVRCDRSVRAACAEASGYLVKDSVKTLYDVENLIRTVAGLAEDGKLTLERARRVLVDPIDDSIFSFLDALNRRDADAALRLLDGFDRLNYDYFRLFSMVVRQARNLLAVKLMSGAQLPDADGQKRMGIGRFEYGKLKLAAQRFTVTELRAWHHACWRIERDMKTGSRALPLQIRLLTVKICVKKK